MAALGAIGTCESNGSDDYGPNHGAWIIPGAWGSLDISLFPVSGVWSTAPPMPVVFPSTAKSIRGRVLNDAGVGIVRRVFCFSHVAGAIIDTTTSDLAGSFELRPADATLCTIFHEPAPADSRNGVVLSLLTPGTH